MTFIESLETLKFLIGEKEVTIQELDDEQFRQLIFHLHEEQLRRSKERFKNNFGGKN